MTIDIDKVGQTIAFLRKRVGYTQKDLADRIGITDKAVSKWERGLAFPDIAYLRKLSILLETDTDSLLAGDVGHRERGWGGLILLDKNDFGVDVCTNIYDKPMVYFLLGYFLLVGIKNILIVCPEQEKSGVKRLIGNGEDYGIYVSYHSGTLKEALDEYALPCDNIMVVYGRCLLYGVDQTRFFLKAMEEKQHCTALVLPKKSESDRFHIRMNIEKKIVKTNEEKPLHTQYDYNIIPILFCPKKLLFEMASEPSPYAESLVAKYIAYKKLYVEMLDRGFVEIEINTWDNVFEASSFLKIVQDKCGMNVYCIEEIAWRKGMINTEQLRRLGERHQNRDYAQYILSLCLRFEN